MSSSDDFPGDMEEFPFDDRDTDAVFGASSGADSVPEELRDLADLVDAARRPGSADEMVGADVIVARIAAAIGEPAALPQGDAHERIPVLRKFRAAKLTAAATAVLMLGGTAAAAATGSLPAPVQNHHKAELTVKRTSSAAEPKAKTKAKAKANVAAKSKARRVVALHKARHGWGKRGTVASVNGVADPGTCGVAGAAGAFVLTGPKGKTFTVNVATTTTYRVKDVTDPSFANVCVGGNVRAKGTVADDVVTATKVVVIPPRPPHVRKAALGKVASVNGVSDPGTCGTAGATGAFMLTGHKDKTFTVNVDPATAFKLKDVETPSFANVCVGTFVLAKGTFVDTTVTATNVFVAPVREKHERKHHKRHARGVFGSVASVNGVTTAGTCGTAGGTGSFTLTGHKDKIFTVNVDGATKFFARGVTGPSFANVCVGSKVGALGEKTDATIAATKAFVFAERVGDGHKSEHKRGVHKRSAHKGRGHK